MACSCFALLTDATTFSFLRGRRGRFYFATSHLDLVLKKDSRGLVCDAYLGLFL